ncbi:MAG TPA: radical SAM family heme chaperone HemW [Acidimicrobiia bacterium]
MAPVVATAPDALELADAAAAWRSAYVHIPFCRRRCPYCDFAVVPHDGGGSPFQVARYIRALTAEFAMEPPWEPLDAVDLGGGTPSSLPASGLRDVLAGLDRRFERRSDAEVSLEANPEDWSAGYADEVRGVGFTRVSLGVQSFDPAVLTALGRLHGPADGEQAVLAARSAGFETVGLDLIYGTPGESAASWEETVERALALDPDHLSAYALTVERGTALSRDVLAGAPGPDPDDQADKYEHLAASASAAGLVRYEVSNWARPGHPCRYNLATWGQGEYLAFGLGAHGHRDGMRRRNVRRLDAYLARVEAGERPEAGAEPITGWSAEQERLMLGLRRAAGVIAGDGGAALEASADGRRLMAAGVLERHGDRLVVAKPLLTDEAVRAVLSLSSGDC